MKPNGTQTMKSFRVEEGGFALWHVLESMSPLQAGISTSVEKLYDSLILRDEGDPPIQLPPQDFVALLDFPDPAYQIRVRKSAYRASQTPQSLAKIFPPTS